MRLGILGLILALLALSNGPAHARDLPVVRPALECGTLSGMVLTDPAAMGQVMSAETVTGDGPAPYCNVKGYVVPQIRFELHLPTTNWTQRLLFNGCGGFCGMIRFAPPRVAEGCVPATDGEFATVTSDLGHNAEGVDTGWGTIPQLRADFGHRGVHVVTIAAKQILARFYDQPQAYAYFNGCSDGGREAMMEAERYPGDFNGIVAGAAVVNEIANNTIFHGWATQHAYVGGKQVFSDAALATLHQAALKACDTLDGDPHDGLIGDPAKCRFDPGVALCKGGEAADSCLTAAQVAAAREIYAGPHDGAGKLYYFGYPVGSELGWNRQTGSMANGRPGGFPAYLAGPPAPSDSMTTVKFTQADVARYYSFAADLNATDSDLCSFQRAGGKLIMWHGWADVAVPAMSSVTFLRAIREKVGAATDGLVRLYMMPGVAHCGGGEGPDKLDLMTRIMAWTEDGVAPGTVTAMKKDADGKVTMTREIQPYR